MKLRSLLFVPGDRPERFAKAAASGADALILDLEDSVAASARPAAREAIAHYLAGERPLPVLVRVNPLDCGMTAEDLDAILAHRPDGIVLPKAEGAASIEALDALLPPLARPPLLPIATETPAAVFELGSYRAVAHRLLGLTWGAEDLPAAIGASTAREADGSFTAPYEMVRALVLFAAHAARVPAIETVMPDFRNMEAVAAYAARGQRDGFTGMMAIHPAQIAAINAGFTPTPEQIAHARAVLAAFAEHPEAGALQVNGKMVDRPHIKQAENLLARAGESGAA